MASLSSAEADAEATYLGAVRALAAALDARDPYTAGHSERVSRFAVAMGEELKLDADAMETLRLGALLHDIGKIGVPDEVLRKPGVLSAAEFESIKTHPSAGARILRSIPFLAPHIPIVELHHERPDGLGYPYGLRGDEDSAARAHRARRRRVRRHDQRPRVSLGPHSRSRRSPSCASASARISMVPSVEALIAALPRLVAARRAGRSRGVPMGSASRAIGVSRDRHGGGRWRSALTDRERCVAQTSRVALDVVAAVDGDHGSEVTPQAHRMVRSVRRGADCRRPGSARRVRSCSAARSTARGRHRFYELALRYERPGAVGLRVDVGQFTSPVGLSILENRPGPQSGRLAAFDVVSADSSL